MKLKYPRTYKLFGFIIIIILIPFLLKMCPVKYEKYKQEKNIEKTDVQYQKEVIHELERNIRVAQFYVWALQENWTGNIFLNQATIELYISFANSQNTSIESIYKIDINIQIAINETYKDFDRIEGIIKKINTVGYLIQDSTSQDTDYLIFVINKSINVLKQLNENIKDKTFFDNKVYLSLRWKNYLASIGNDFLQKEGRKIASGPR